MRILHIVPGIDDVANGMAVVARLLAKAQGDAEVVDLNHEIHKIHEEEVEEVWVHGMWLPKEWAACRAAVRAGKRLVRMTHGSLSPIYLEKQGKWKKRLVSPIERHYFAKCDRIAVTGSWEEEWCRKWGLPGPFEIIDLKQFFPVPSEILGQTLNLTLDAWQTDPCRPLHILYFGRRHPLKGVEYLESAVQGLTNVDLRIVSDAFGDDKEKVWDWCDVLVLPTLSENFGLVIAEALERGKCVVTTDGAPAWGDGNDYGGRLVYVKGYRDGTDEERVNLLKDAIRQLTTNNL